MCMDAKLKSGKLVMVNFMSQLDWAKDAQIADETLFLVVSVRVYMDETDI